MITRMYRLAKFFVRFFYQKTICQSDYFEVVYQAVQELGGIYVKLVQFVSLKTDLFPDQEKIKFLSFYDQVASGNIKVEQILSEELGPEKMREFRSFEDRPFASGTFGQVYKGQLVDGTQVIIKIKRPNLYLKLKMDFLLLKFLALIFNLFYYQRVIDVRKLLREFEQMTYKELDYRTEAENAEFFRHVYQNHPVVFIPRTFTHFVTDRILVQEYVGGIAATDLIRWRYQSKIDYRSWLSRNYHTDLIWIMKDIAYELARQGLYFDKYYADPHPGNIKILPNNRFAFVDFGIVGNSPKNKRNYYEIIKLLAQKAQDLDMKGLGKQFLEWGAADLFRSLKTLDDHFAQGKLNLTEAVINKYTQILEGKREKFREIERGDKENFAMMYLDIISAGEALTVTVPQGLLPLIRTVAVYKYWCGFLEPDLYYMREVYQRVLAGVDYNNLINEEYLKEKKVNLEGAIEKIFDWTCNLAESDWPLFNQLSNQLKGSAYV
jgi:predicted unusual protein kinase regulating ubiquinone biosynthesis (AarF/ABC1/UbiB family)